ncbi:TRAP transporter small permease subunit [Amphritea sp. 2_MG-2023]|uniref:TRAP transporter small permease subunit n=1 Tax=Amphritea TaxID=515417 RepID=UPI001C07D3C9|nr:MULTISPECIES: TRAP transporter small permease subunit [Amphritea]MBU2967316.1 TRAP transporter small permease subunit [Amphritea atlantica]MDO6420464.1 TRAP transporter small permease subunit [Amphritea sp. 2_MG-2023]
MNSADTWLIRQCESVAIFLGGVAQVCIFGVIVTVASNVLLRFLFDIGSVWSQELEWHFLAAVATLGLAYTYNKGEHVRVDLIYNSASPQFKAIIDLLSAGTLLTIAVLICYYSLPYIYQSWESNEISADPGGLTMRYLLKGLILVGFTSLGLQSLAEILKNLPKAIKYNGSDD